MVTYREGRDSMIRASVCRRMLTGVPAANWTSEGAGLAESRRESPVGGHEQQGGKD